MVIHVIVICRYFVIVFPIFSALFLRGVGIDVLFGFLYYCTVSTYG
jgi:hypothetical protein